MKTKDCSLPRVKFATADTCLKHNFEQCKGHLLVNLKMLSENVIADLEKLDSKVDTRVPARKKRPHSPDTSAGPSGYTAGAV